MWKSVAVPVLVAPALAGYGLSPAQPVDRAGGGGAGGVLYLKQGWSDDDRARYYTTPQGSMLIPYAWFLHLEQATSRQPFRADENIERFRYLPGARDDRHNPDGLPVGFTREPSDALRAEGAERKLLRAFFRPWGADGADFPGADAWLGLTCAACHTGQLEVGGKRLRVDGAPALADINRFTHSLAHAVETTLEDRQKFDRFAAKVLGDLNQPAGRGALRRRLTAYAGALGAYRDRGSSPQFAHGYGRTDALGSILNEVLGTALGVPANYRPTDAPVSYPDLWLTPKLDWVQWNGSVANPFGRNVGEVLGVFGHVDAGAVTPAGFASTVRGANLHRLEQLVDKLEPPAWDEGVLGKLDAARVKRGAGVYAAHCASCHGDGAKYPMTAPNPEGKQFIKTTMVPLKVVGTDPKAAINFAEREAFPGVLGQPTDPPVKAGGLLRQVVFQVTARQFRDLKLTPAEQKAYIGFRTGGEPPNLLAYKAKPLAGVWATAPYLHNGSVPSLRELLQPPAQRAKLFWVGSREFDPAAVGYKSDRYEGGFLFDTSLPGNSNAGHDWGTDRTDAEKVDLIEYLKTL